MPIVAIDRLNTARPDWLPLTRGQVLALSPGQTVPARVSDSPEIFFVLEGEVVFHEGTESRPVTAGSVVCIYPGTIHAITRVNGSATVLHVAGEPVAPFRHEPFESSQVESVPLPPLKALAAPVRQGFSVTIDPLLTFSPAFLGQGEGAGLIIACDLNNTPKNLLSEIRKHCFKEALMVAALVLPIKTEKALEEFMRLPEETAIALSMHPFLMGIDADLSTPEGRGLAKALRRFWSMRLGLNGIRPCVRMPLGNWSDATCADVFRELHRLPPRRFAVVMTLTEEFDASTPRNQRILRALEPWLGAIEVNSTDQRDSVSRLLDASSSQAWVLIRK